MTYFECGQETQDLLVLQRLTVSQTQTEGMKRLMLCRLCGVFGLI